MQTAREFRFTEQDFGFISRLIGERTGIVLGQSKREMMYGRLARRLRARRLSSFADYRKLLESPEGDGELTHMINALTTNLTKFFRENHHFEHLRSVALKAAAAGGQRARIRIWSAGCSSGQEPFSIAMSVAQAVPDFQLHDIKILATDLDTNMVARGQAGEYSAAEVQSIPEDRREACMDPVDGAGQVFRFKDSLRALISFKPLNLLEEWPMRGPFDAVFMRNVIIYFGNDTQARLLDRMWRLLKDTGFLYIGHSENINRVTDRFAVCGRTIFRKNLGAARLPKAAGDVR